VDHQGTLIAGTALSTTSLAVVYAVLVESGLNATRIGKLIMSACFVTDLATAVALSVLFISPNAWFAVFVVVSVAVIVALPKLSPRFFSRYGDRVIEPEIKLVFLCLFVFMVLADASNGQAVLPAFVLGLVMSRHYREHRSEQQRLRVVAFAFLTPFFFLRGGLEVSLGAVLANLGALAVLAAAKLVPKVALVLPLARRHVAEHAMFTTLLMSTGLTFGTISSLTERAQRGGHRPHAVLAAGDGGRPVGDRPDRDRPAPLRAEHGRGRSVAAADACAAARHRGGARMSPFAFTDVLVPVDGSPGADATLDCALALCASLDARLTALAVEGRLPAYAASLGEVDEVKAQKDTFFEAVLLPRDGRAMNAEPKSPPRQSSGARTRRACRPIAPRRTTAAEPPRQRQGFGQPAARLAALTASRSLPGALTARSRWVTASLTQSRSWAAQNAPLCPPG
jgi:Kef-type K+ transport system membrane component KefB